MIPNTVVSILAVIGAHRLITLANAAVARKLEDRAWRRTIGDIRHLPTVPTEPVVDYDLIPDPNDPEDIW